ncbi:hypothetical protein [Salinivibrio socompensis]|nr:hypothetical protein [Salinivibrio socompensis]
MGIERVAILSVAIQSIDRMNTMLPLCRHGIVRQHGQFSVGCQQLSYM